jgi:hypothetical protein
MPFIQKKIIRTSKCLVSTITTLGITNFTVTTITTLGITNFTVTTITTTYTSTTTTTGRLIEKISSEMSIFVIRHSLRTTMQF